MGQLLPGQLTPFRASSDAARWPNIPSPQLPATPNVPYLVRETPGKGSSVALTLPEGGSTKPRKEASTFWTERSPDLCQQQDMERVCAFLRRWRMRRRRRRKSRKQEQTKKEEAAWSHMGGGWTMRGTPPFTLNSSQWIEKKPTNHSTTPTAIGSKVFFGHPGF